MLPSFRLEPLKTVFTATTFGKLCFCVIFFFVCFLFFVFLLVGWFENHKVYKNKWYGTLSQFEQYINCNLVVTEIIVLGFYLTKNFDWIIIIISHYLYIIIYSLF